MAAQDTLLAFSERVHSYIWWKVKTGWTDEEYLSRKNALLNRIRGLWSTNKLEDYSCHDIADGIESLIVTFDDSKWCLPKESDRIVVFAEQLRLYTKWALVIRSDHILMSGTDLYTIRASATTLSTPLLTTHPGSLVVSESQSARENEDRITSLVKSDVAAQDTTISNVVNKQSFEWDEIEVRLDVAGPGSLSIRYFPITDLTADKAGKPCRSADFTRPRFLDYCKAMFDFQPVSTLFWIDGTSWARINGDGEFKLMLKRLSEKHDTNGTLHLHVCPYDKPSITGLSEVPRSLLRASASD